jgi:hypothetical protein
VQQLAKIIEEKGGKEVDGFFLALEIKVKRKIVRVEGILKKTAKGYNLLVRDGLKRDKSLRFKSYGPGTRVLCLL